ncbi:hypothetical protein H2684_08670 [Clostridium sp. cel8]|jgi:hypothetical protein|uniref:hypothetical protein n=1 Tax=unclassified Clostridium TaxID=2614128 RepID=UPI0015F4FABD|nr:hypothetical protein [Clostridium sp. cel8]MBA5851378.1 hypothetical protein [Clostridium sp. cel8]
MSNDSSKAMYMAKGGILTAIGVLLIYLSRIMPVNKAYILALASFIIPLSIVITDVKNSIVVYISTSILSFLICGLDITVIAYVLFFGSYGFVKLYTEKLHKLVIEIILKLVFVNICAAIMLLIYNLFFPGLFNFKFAIYWIMILLQISFILYDYLITLIINFANKRIGKTKLY